MSKINQYALENYTAEGYPKLHFDVGDEGLKAIQEHDHKAAQIVAELKECDEVMYVGYSSESAYPETLVSFVDCKNGRRFWVTNGVLGLIKEDAEAQA